MKKNFLPYLPAYVSKGKTWYITFYQTNPVTGQRERIKRRYGLNLIKSISERNKAARKIINQINELLPTGYPFSQVELLVNSVEKLTDTFQIALDNKLLSDRVSTRNTYRSIGHIFLDYLRASRKDRTTIAQFNKREAIFFMNHLVKNRSIRATAYNNYLTYMKSLFSELVRMEYLDKNPFVGIQSKRKTRSARKHFSEHDRRIVAREILKTNLFLFRAVLLQYYCMLRPVEIRKLRFQDFHFDKSKIVITEETAKTKKYRTPTIPDRMLDYFDLAEFSSYPKHYYVFGARLVPNPKNKCSKNYMGVMHKKILEKLQSRGAVADISHYTFYSWKYTGMTTLDELNISPIGVMDQAGQNDLNQILAYVKRDKINPRIKELQMDIF